MCTFAMFIMFYARCFYFGRCPKTTLKYSCHYATRFFSVISPPIRGISGAFSLRRALHIAHKTTSWSCSRNKKHRHLGKETRCS